MDKDEIQETPINPTQQKQEKSKAVDTTHDVASLYPFSAKRKREEIADEDVDYYSWMKKPFRKVDGFINFDYGIPNYNMGVCCNPYDWHETNDQIYYSVCIHCFPVAISKLIGIFVDSEAVRNSYWVICQNCQTVVPAALQMGICGEHMRILFKCMNSWKTPLIGYPDMNHSGLKMKRLAEFAVEFCKHIARYCYPDKREMLLSIDFVNALKLTLKK